MEWQHVIRILTDKIMPFYDPKKQIEREDELISRLWSNENVRGLIHLWLKDHYDKKRFKCITKAQNFKTRGNKAFAEKNYTNSIVYYTKSALFAPADSTELAIAMANRSAALFYLNRYQDCLKDVKYAINLNYPKQLHYKLHVRIIQCYAELGIRDLMEEQVSKIMELICDSNYVTPNMKENLLKKIGGISLKSSVQNVIEEKTHLEKLKSQFVFEENVNFPCAAASIDREYNEKLGRHVVANRFIKKGEVLFLEKPVSFVPLHETSPHDHCQNCNCPTRDVPVPCTQCLNSFYCNKDCFIEAMSSFHQWECPGCQMELWTDIGIGHLALKVLLMCSTLKDKTKFNEMQNLVTNLHKLPIADLIVYGITAVMLTKYLSEYTNYFEMNNLEDCLIDKFFDTSFYSTVNTVTTKNKQLYISSLLLRYILQLIANGHTITKLNTSLIDNGPYINEDLVATGIFPSASMMNHSCDPNIINIFVGQYLIVKAEKNIAPSEEVFNCYGPHYRHMTTQRRQEILKSQYCFSCKCKPCIESKLQYFLERFNAIKCTKCHGVIFVETNSMFCLDCGSKPQGNVSRKIEHAEIMFKEAQACLEFQNMEEALEKLKKCMQIRTAVLYKYNMKIVDTLNLMAEIYKITGNFIKSIKCLENTIDIITERFGSSSLKLLNQLNILIHVYALYWQRELNDSSDSYKNTQAKYKKYLNLQKELHSLVIIEEVTNT